MTSPSTPKAPLVPDGRTPMWRAHNALRVVTFLYALVYAVMQFNDYKRPVLALATIVIMGLWTAFTIWRYWTWAGRTTTLVVIDQLVVTILFLGGKIILSDQQLLSGAPSVVTIWQNSMVTVAAVYWGMIGGGISGVVAASSSFLVRGYSDSGMWMDAVLLISGGAMIGLCGETVRKSTERLTRALRIEAATAERERLARSIHDSVLQVLARVRRRGSELGGEAAELARLAGEQEIALRSLIATTPPDPNENGEIDLAARLFLLRSTKVQVSVPATAVLLPAALGSDLFAMIQEALSNVEHHAGPNAHAWVLLEDLGDEIVLSIRDDGPGIPEGRLAEAAAEGRLGVVKSIRGRIESLGGKITLDTAPGEGTEWEVRVPRPSTTAPARAGGSHFRKGGQR